jgi:hypothetical protein
MHYVWQFNRFPLPYPITVVIVVEFIGPWSDSAPDHTGNNYFRLQ